MSIRILGFVAMSALVLALPAGADFAIDDDGKMLSVTENGKPVLSYRYTRVEPPEAAGERYARMDYIHPLYGLDGDILTDDFPDDHYHHRGIFWAWPRCAAGDREMNIWELVGARPVFEQWLKREADAEKAEIASRSVWLFDDDPEPRVREEMWLTVLPADKRGRAIDVRLLFTNVGKETFSIRGQTDGNKGYGGFCFRPDKKRIPLTFTSASGVVKEDVLEFDTPWADLTSTAKPDGPTSGLAIFQHPANPGYPHKGWIFRNYGFLGASWPHNEPYKLEPGQSVELRYRVYVHRGTARQGKVAARFKAYTKNALKEMER